MVTVAGAPKPKFLRCPHFGSGDLVPELGSRLALIVILHDIVTESRGDEEGI